MMRTGENIRSRSYDYDNSIVKDFIEKNAWSLDKLQQNPNYRDPFKQGETILHIAAEQGDAYVTEQLLLLGLDPNIKNDCGKTALHKTEDFDTIECLLRHGADANATFFTETYRLGWGISEQKGGTALHRVANKNYSNSSQSLICCHDCLLQAGIIEGQNGDESLCYSTKITA